MKQNRHSEKNKASYDEFIRRMNLSHKADNPELVLDLVLGWTKGQPLLTRKLFQCILQSKQKISLGKEALIIEQIVRFCLLKEFPKNDVTLAIRIFLYKKKLANLLKQTNGKIIEREQTYLIALQKELGLSNQQCQTIKNNILTAKTFKKTKNNQKNIVGKQKQSQNNGLSISRYKETSQASSSLAKKSDSSVLRSQAIISKNQKSAQKNRLRSKWFWLLLGFPISFLFIKGLNWNKNYQSNIAAESITQQEQLCVDLTSRQSPRMSLGEKILTPEHTHLKPQSVILLYEGSAAFARCEFTSAQQKFQESLKIAKNNPEALIYFNNISAITQDHLKIAVSVPLSKSSDIAWEILRGVAQAQAEINQQGGIGKKLLLVQIVNDNNDPEIIPRIAQQLVADRSILAVVGHNDSNASIAGSKIYQKEGLVMITPTSSSTKLSGIGNYIFRTAFSVAALANTLADYISVNSLTNVTICFDSSSSASTSFVREFTSEMIEDRVEKAAVECDFARKDFNPERVIEQAIAQKSDALLLAPSVIKLDRAITVARANQQQLPLLGNHTLYTAETIEQGKDAVAGMVLSSPWLPNIDAEDPEDHFLQTTTKYWGGKVNWRTATSYDATLTIARGLEQSRTREQLQSVLNQPDFFVYGATGKISFNNGDRFGQVKLVRITKSDGKSSQYQFSPLKLN